MELDLSLFNQKLKWAFDKDQLQLAFNQQNKLFQDILTSNVVNKFDNKMTIKQNTLIHGTKFDYEKLLSIKKSGILSGDFVGNEDRFEETPFHADFFRIEKDMTLFDFYLTMNGTRDWNGYSFSHIKKLGETPSANYIDVSNCRLPFLKIDESKNNVAFVINGDCDYLKKLQYYDFFINSNNATANLVSKRNTRCFNPEEMSAIFMGVPCNLFSLIIVGEEVEKDEQKMQFLKHIFSNLPILSSNGSFIYIPKNEREYYDVKNINKCFEKELNSFCEKEMNYTPNSLFVDRIMKNKQKRFINVEEM